MAHLKITNFSHVRSRRLKQKKSTTGAEKVCIVHITCFLGNTQRICFDSHSHTSQCRRCIFKGTPNDIVNKADLRLERIKKDFERRTKLRVRDVATFWSSFSGERFYWIRLNCTIWLIVVWFPGCWGSSHCDKERKDRRDWKERWVPMSQPHLSRTNTVKISFNCPCQVVRCSQQWKSLYRSSSCSK